MNHLLKNKLPNTRAKLAATFISLFLIITYSARKLSESKGRLSQADYVQYLPLRIDGGQQLGGKHGTLSVTQAFWPRNKLTGFTIPVVHSGTPKASYCFRVSGGSLNFPYNEEFQVPDEATEIHFSLPTTIGPDKENPLEFSISSIDPDVGGLVMAVSQSSPEKGTQNAEFRGVEPPYIIFSPKYIVSGASAARFFAAQILPSIIMLAIMIGAWLFLDNPGGALASAFATIGCYFAMIRIPGYGDENGHFAYAYHLLEKQSLPLVNAPTPIGGLLRLAHEVGRTESAAAAFSYTYEAVQPPLYYIMSAVMLRASLYLTESIVPGFYAMRLINVAFIAAAIRVALGSYKFLYSQGILKSGIARFSACAALFVVSPWFLMTQTVVSNDALLIYLCTVLFSRLFEETSNRSVRKTSEFELGFFFGLAVLTKVNAVYVGAIIFGYLLVNRRVSSPVKFISASLIWIAPWLVFNWRHYHALTGMAHHLDFVTATLNPSHGVVPLAFYGKSAASIFFLGYFDYPWPVETTRFLFIASLLLTASLCIESGGLCLRLRDIYANKALPASLNSTAFSAILVGAIIAPFLMTCLLTWKSNLVYVIPRYSYASFLCIVALLHRGVEIIFSPRFQFVFVAVLLAGVLYCDCRLALAG